MKLKGMARIAKSFQIEAGGFRARGAPAVILAAGGVVLVAGIVRLLSQNASVLPETLREAKGLIESLRSENLKRLNS
ncbi:MAG: hypothetical protein M3126_09325 [Candidatus Eremiobacteraeota bacterium]|nr:hypothetical protein [Candidatus Eremiobacteraeota bacterium]